MRLLLGSSFYDMAVAKVFQVLLFSCMNAYRHSIIFFFVTLLLPHIESNQNIWLTLESIIHYLLLFILAVVCLLYVETREQQSVAL